MVALLLGSATTTVYAQTEKPQPQTVQDKDEKGRSVTRLSGFDPQEFGGNDSDCTLEDNPDVARLGEEVGSPREACKSIVEWSLKNGDQTIASGFYAMQPYEWFRFNQPYEATNGNVRFVGSFWRVPRGWNAHILAMDYAGDWQEKNPGLLTIVGLSPMDTWVQGLWQDAESQFDSDVFALTATCATQPASTAIATAMPTIQPTLIVFDPSSCDENLAGWLLNPAKSTDAGHCVWDEPPTPTPLPTPTPAPSQGEQMATAWNELVNPFTLLPALWNGTIGLGLGCLNGLFWLAIVGFLTFGVIAVVRAIANRR